jgi:hypothetical protein
MLAAHHGPELHADADDLQEGGHQVLAVTCDVADETQVAGDDRPHSPRYECRCAP